MIGAALTGALGAALIGSPHCVGMCGALACGAGERVEQQIAYHTGRITTYAALGAASGAVGHIIPGPDWVSGAVAAVMLVGFAAALAGWLPEPRLPLGGLTAAGANLVRRTDLPSRLLFGMVNGLLPCGLVYATLGLAVSTTDPLAGATVMTVFGLGTVPALGLSVLGLKRVLSGSLRARRVLAAGVVVFGLGSLAFREGLLTPGAADSDMPPCHQESTEP